MKNIKTYIAIAPVVILSLMPPLGMYVPFTDKVAWTWLFLIFGFAGVSTFFLKINPFIKALAALCFINVFFSKAPFISQFAFMQVIGCIYLYVLCLRIDAWKVAFNALWGILALNVMLIGLQCIGKDNLLNFGFYQASCHGVVGNEMMLKSYLLVLFALLIQQYKPSKKKLVAASVCAVVIAITYCIAHRALVSFMFARGPVWFETIRLTFQHPFVGWGIGTYKAIFASIAQLPPACQTEGRWISCHNDYLQVVWECGIPMALVFLGLIYSLLCKCRGVLLFGALMICYTLMVHFPMRTTQIVPLLVLFVAYIERTQYGSSK